MEEEGVVPRRLIALLLAATVLAALALAVSTLLKETVGGGVFLETGAEAESASKMLEKPVSASDLSFPALLRDTQSLASEDASVQRWRESRSLPADPQGTEERPLAREQGNKSVLGASVGGYAVQVMSFRDRPSASEMAQKLEQRGFRSFVASADIPGRGTFFRVRVGRFKSRYAAKRAQKRLEQQESLPGFVVDETLRPQTDASEP